MTPQAAQAILPLVGLLAFLLATLAVFVARALLLGPPRTPEIAQRQRSLIGKFFQEWWVWLFGPAERFCVRLRISPDVLTLVSAGVTVAAGVFLGLGWLSLGGWVYLFGASLDFIDGRVARATGRVTRAGAFLDSTLDRVADMAVLGGLTVALRDTPLVLVPVAAAATSVLVPYARARGEALGAGASAKVGGMQRPERVVLTGVATALSPLADAAGLPGGAHGLIGAALAVLAVSSAVTAARRTAAIYWELRAAEPREPRPAPRRLADVFRLDPARRRGAAP